MYQGGPRRLASASPCGSGENAYVPIAMIKAFQSELGINVIASIIASLFCLAAGCAWGKYKERQRKFGRNLEEYDFYPFTFTREHFGEFSLNEFLLAMH